MTQIPPPLAAELRQVAHRMADAARAAILPHFRAPDLAAANKSEDDFDPVTAADREAEAAMRDILARERPDDGILGEEFAAQPSTSGLTWVLDPIDGTRAFIAGTPTWGVLIAVNAGGAPIYGIVDQPFTGERYEGGLGTAQWTRAGAERPLATRPCATLAEAVLFTTFPEVGTQAERSGFEAVRDRVRMVRYGMDCYAYALVALGQVDLVIEAGLNAYDIQGPQAVIEGAGGIVTAWDGGPVHDGGRAVAAGDARIHAQALELLAGVA